MAEADDAEKKIFEEVLSEAAAKATSRSATPSRSSRMNCASSARPSSRSDREAFRAAALPLHNDGSGGWSKAEYDALQALK